MMVGLNNPYDVDGGLVAKKQPLVAGGTTPKSTNP
jgi:hypothetical protein